MRSKLRPDDRSGYLALLPYLLPYLGESGHFSVSLGARKLFITNNSQRPFLEGEGLKIGRSAVRPRCWPPTHAAQPVFRLLLPLTWDNRASAPLCHERKRRIGG
jgi:hypothetical protein